MQNSPSFESAAKIISEIIATHRDAGHVYLEDTFKAAYFQTMLENLMVEIPEVFTFMKARLDAVKRWNA